MISPINSSMTFRKIDENDLELNARKKRVSEVIGLYSRPSLIIFDLIGEMAEWKDTWPPSQLIGAIGSRSSRRRCFTPGSLRPRRWICDTFLISWWFRSIVN